MASALPTAAEKTAAFADRLSAAFARQLAGVMREVERRLRGILDDVADGSPTATLRAAQAIRVRQEIRRVLQSSGYDVLVDAAAGGALDRMADRVMASRRTARVPHTLTPATSLSLSAMRTLHLLDLLDEGQVITRTVTQAVMRGLLGAQPTREILPALAKVLDFSQARVATLYDTAVSIYGRQVEALQAGNEPGTKFLYAGPVDEKTRPFCLARVGKVFTREAIDEMDNRQISNVFLSGGGYNCRHVFMEVSRFSELQEMDEGQRVPEIQKQLERLKEAA